MGLQKITFEGGNVTSKIDADLYHFLFSSDVGVLKGLKNECSYSLSNNLITFSDGYISVYGRIIYIESQTSVDVTPDSNKYGYVVLGVNTSDNTVSLYIKEQVSTYPSLTTTNLLESSGLYELVLCAYEKTTTSVTLTSYNIKYITQDKSKTLEINNELIDYYKPHQYDVIQVSGGVYKIIGVNYNELIESIVYVVINGHVSISFPADVMFNYIGSNAVFNYRYGGSDYSLSLFYENGTLTFTCGLNTHKVNSVYLKK